MHLEIMTQFTFDVTNMTMIYQSRLAKRREQTVGSPEVKISTKDLIPLRNMKAYLSNPKNKDNINQFTFEKWIEKMPDVLTKDQTLVLSGRFKNHERVEENWKQQMGK